MARSPQALDRTIVVVDVAGFTTAARNRVAVRDGLYGVLRTAFAESDLEFDSFLTEDRGDGALILLPPDTPKSAAADRLPDRVLAALRRYNHSQPPLGQIRLRVSLNSGEVLNDGNGWVGEAIDTAFRILDARQAKEAIVGSNRMIAFISSARFFDEVIRPDPGLLPELYTEIPVTVRTFTGTAYLRLVGEPAASTVEPSPVLSPATDPVQAMTATSDRDLYSPADLATLRSHLVPLEVPHLAVLMNRALGPAVPLPSLDHVTDAWRAFQVLMEFNVGPDGIPPTITFLRLLAEQFGGASGAAITDWASDQVRRLGLDPVVAQPRSTPPEIPEPGEPARPEPDTKVDWASDAPALEDHLSRASLADVLATQLREVRGKAPSTSFLIHLDGAWGTGKSTLLIFLEDRLGDEFTVVRFDAWRQSRLGPPWWALLSATREAVARERNFVARSALRVAEGVARARRVGSAVTLTVFLIALVVAGLAVFLLPRITGGDALAALAKAGTAVVAALAALWAGARVVGRTLLWDSVRGARLFEQSTPNPMDQVAAHFDWILGKARKPVLFFIDDLDRCPGGYVVELLDAVQTLIRDIPARASATEHSAAYFVVAADGAWLRKSYEDAFPSFHDSVSTPGYSLGYLFLDKLFQLTVPVPMPSTRARTTYLERLLNIAAPHHDEAVKQEITDGKTALAGADDESEILGIINSASPDARDKLARDAALALVSPQTRAHTEHALSKFLPLLHPNPRNIKKFLNTYSILRSVRTLEQNTVGSDVLALWTIIRVRWPSIAEHLETDPEAVRALVEPLWASECLPLELRDLATDTELRAVILHPEGGPLTADLIRQCAGTEWQ
ncbi:P-loop NTPase fold protein [Amycolatopsis sp. NPDC051071]|uniref:P-loop NTPase fold protein n=1 Tax=Amycolatopsis sp. NPDC051071 TaxID=3154637 RepID=UPI003412B520